MVSDDHALGTFSILLVHPSSQILLTNICPLNDCYSDSVPEKKPHRLTSLKFENRSGPRCSDFSNHSLYDVNNIIVGYPEGNFEGNQLLDCSIGLSPLYQHPTNDLHVSTEIYVQLSFLRLHIVLE